MDNPEKGEGISQIEVEVERFPVVKDKFNKESWDSGEGGGEGEG